MKTRMYSAERPVPRSVTLLRSLFLSALLPAFLASFLASCDGGDPSGHRATQRDSAGITIVENRAPIPTDSEGWALSPEPLLSIGTVEGEDAYQFYGLAGAHRMADGRIGVVNAGTREVRFFSPEGDHLASFGQQCGGPEEFEMPALVGAFHDTLVIVDRAHHRLTYVHPDVGFVRLARVSDEVGGFLNPSGLFGNGHAVFGGAFDMRRADDIHNGMNRAHTFYRSCDPEGTLAADFGDKLGAEFYIGDLEGSGQESRPALFPFGKVSLATVSPSFLYFSDQSDWEIEVSDHSGTLVRLIRTAWDPRSVTQVDGERFIEGIASGAGNAEQAAQIRQYYGNLPLAESFPPFASLMADRSGYLWVDDFQHPGGEPGLWTIFDSDGVLAGRLALPDGFHALEIGEDYVLGAARDDLDVEYLRLYELTRPGGG